MLLNPSLTTIGIAYDYNSGYVDTVVTMESVREPPALPW